MVEPCGLTLIAGSPGGINMMLHGGMCFPFFLMGGVRVGWWFFVFSKDRSP